MTDLALASCVEQGVRFETGVPVTFRFVRNTERSPYFGSAYGQDIEPAGRYMLHNEDPGTPARRWETGVVTFQNPLVILFALDERDPYGPTGWKARLRDVYGATGAELTRRILAAGHDAIVTVGEFTHLGRTTCTTREILDLTPLRVTNPRRRPSSGRQLGVGRCTVRGCGRDHYARGWCMRHYMQWLDHGRRLSRRRERDDLAIEFGVCRAPHCILDAAVRGYCRKHAAQIREHGRLVPERELGLERLCRLPDCGEPHWARGYCMGHYNRNRWRWTRRNPDEATRELEKAAEEGDPLALERLYAHAMRIRDLATLWGVEAYKKVGGRWLMRGYGGVPPLSSVDDITDLLEGETYEERRARWDRNKTARRAREAFVVSVLGFDPALVDDTLRSPRVKFNGGYHDAWAESERGRPRRLLLVGPDPAAPNVVPGGGAVVRHFDPAYWEGYRKGLEYYAAGRADGADNSDPAWLDWLDEVSSGESSGRAP